jgi:uncharacterized membrane protein
VNRVTSLDALRGLVMIIMALDHTRDYFHVHAAAFQPENLERATAALFLTRWITHICAPVFLFTAGAGAYLWLQRRGRAPAELTRFLLTRGLWLVFLDLTVLRFAMFFTLIPGPPIILSILWAIGWSMVALALLSRIPLRPLAILSCAAIALHNLADKVPPSPLWDIFHQQALIQVAGVPVLVAYPLIPWIFVMSAGFCFGRLFLLEPAVRGKWFLLLGVGLTLAFLVVRGLNVYGNPLPWTTQFPGKTVLSFLNCAKYPPSLSFLLMTLGPALLILAWFDTRRFSPSNPLIVFGRTPLFYFLGHFFLIHLLTIPISRMTGQPAASFHLPGVYAVTAAVVLAMYPACLWFSRLKQRHPSSTWLSYL